MVVSASTATAFDSQVRGVCSGSHPALISHENLGPNAKETAWRCVEEEGILTTRPGGLHEGEEEREAEEEEEKRESSFGAG